MPSGTAQAPQSTDSLLMVSPRTFKFNVQTAGSNVFQKEINISNDVALHEFNSMVDVLRNNNIRVVVMPSRENAETPDSIFPDWFSFHTDEKTGGRVLVLYPMATKNRRLELQPENLISHLKKDSIYVNEIIDLSSYANESLYLEATGSLVLDRSNRIAYASISPRTDPEMVNIFAKKLNYKPITFHSYDKNNQLLYHTDLMISVGSNFAVVALESISDAEERDAVLKQLNKNNKEIIPITLEQVRNMAGNMIEVKSTDGKAKIVMSESAYNAYTPEQRSILSKHGDIIPVNIKNIETVGGGSARCMIGEIF